MMQPSSVLVFSLAILGVQSRAQRPRGTDSSNLGVHPADNCICTPYYKCFDDATGTDIFGIVDDRVNMIDNQTIITVKPTNEPAVCPTTLEVRCCRLNPPGVGNRPVRPAQTTISNSQCGARNNGGVDVKVQGFNDGQAQFGEFPWTVALLTSNFGFGSDNGVNNLFLGGGSLIHPQVVLTAAHKPFDNGANKTLIVRLGEWNFADREEPIPHQDIVVREVIYEPRFNRDSMMYNVALLILDKPAELGLTVRTICLPSNPAEIFNGSQCILSGWGKDVFGEEGRYQRIMKEVNVNMVEHSQCQREMRNTPRLGRKFNLHSSFVCAGDRGQDACTGDGGSPLVCPHNGGYVQVGVSAWGIGCGQPGLPGVYSAVAPTIEWIQGTLNRGRSLGLLGTQ